MSRTLRSALLVLALANLLASAAFALPRASRPAPTTPAGVTAVWERLVGLFEPAAKAPGKGDILKAGSQMDPNGTPRSGTIYSGSTTDAGSQMDPDGLK
jgi:hypothetical protein